MSPTDLSSTTSLVLHSPWQIFAVGCVGGFAGDAAAIWGARLSRPPDYVRSPYFWLCAIGMAIVGGGLAVLYGYPREAILVVNIGASAPLLMQSLASGVPRRREPRIG